MADAITAAAVPRHAGPRSQAGNNESNATTAPRTFHHATGLLVDFFYPAPIRSEYCLIFTTLSRYRTAYIILAVVLIFSIAEYEQPGWFPRPDQLNSAAIGFLGASILIIPTLALFEYDETHTWPWDDEGFVWPWEALLWSGTVYNDEAFDESMATYPDLHTMPASYPLRASTQRRSVGEYGRALNATTGELASSSSLEASSAKRNILPPAYLLPDELRTDLLSPARHCSGLLGPSPVPLHFHRINEKSESECSEPDHKSAA